MLIGREALRNGFLVDAGESFLGGRAPRPVRRLNRGAERRGWRRRRAATGGPRR